MASAVDYYPFGWEMPGRGGSSEAYRYGFNGKEKDDEGEFGSQTNLDFGARIYNPAIGRWLSLDPMMREFSGWSPYNYVLNNPMIYIDPDGESPISALIKAIAKVGIKEGLKSFGEKHIKRRLKKYMSKSMSKQFAKDLDSILGTLDNTWWETGLEMIPVVGDLYGASKLAKKVSKAYDKLQDLENKYIGKIIDKLPEKKRKEFIKKIRGKGVSDAKKDIDTRKKTTGVTEGYKGKEGHHKTSVKADPSKATDPRNIEFVDRKEHLKKHNGNFRNKTHDSSKTRRNN